MKGARGFTLIEVLIVIIIMAITLTIGGMVFSRYFVRTSAKRAAVVFGQDLTVARNTAARSRQVVVVDFDEGGLGYVVRLAAGDTLLSRSFDDGSDVRLSSLDLEFTGDTVAFNARGVADLSEASGPVGRAQFTAGTITYVVSFNSIGSSRIEGS
ncbi:GspH/FimT family pseudopilin [Gemmatimonadota bacterium]